MARLGVVMAAAFVSWGCSATQFVSSWRAPDAVPLKAKGSPVAAVVMMQGEASRRAAEDRLASEITAHGGKGIPMYAIMADSSSASEAEARAALEKAGIHGVIVMRPVGKEKEVVAVNNYSSPTYSGYWGGYYPYGWGSAYGSAPPGEITTRTNTIVSVETLVYSLEQNKLVWGGQSKTTNPENIDQLISEIAEATADELEKEGLLAK